MPPTKTKKTQSRNIAPDDPPSSTRKSKLKSHRTVKLEAPEVTIHQKSSVPHPTLAINEPSISKPKCKAYYAIKPKLQEVAPSQKAPIPYLSLAVLEELWVIWKSDPRVPTIASRHAWAASRNISPIRVDNWFSVRKGKAKKARQPIANETYELSLEPRVVPVTLGVKRELLSPSPACSSDTTDITLPSDDTLVPFGADCPDAFSMSPRSSVTSDLSMTPELTDGHAYMLHGAQKIPLLSYSLTLETNDGQKASYGKDRYSPAPSFSIYDDLGTDSIFCSQYSSHNVCNQGNPDLSDFTCTLCKPMEDYSQIALDQLVQESIFPFEPSLAMLPTYARLDPDSDTLMELSAIPYLYCTPSLADTLALAPFGSSDCWMEGGTNKRTY